MRSVPDPGGRLTGDRRDWILLLGKCLPHQFSSDSRFVILDVNSSSRNVNVNAGDAIEPRKCFRYHASTELARYV